jgi:hypothetical protein
MSKRGGQHRRPGATKITVMDEVGLFLYRTAPFVAAAGAAYTVLKS